MSTAQKIINGLLILNSYPGMEMTAHHDEIMAGPTDVSLVNEEDKAKLAALGFTYNDDYDCWSVFT